MDPITSEHGACAEREDGTHCECWWDGGTCCSCGAVAMTDEEMALQGMTDGA